MRVDFRPSVVECRIYEKGGYQQRSAYVGSFVMHLAGDEALLTLLTGENDREACVWDQQIDREVARYLLSKGIRKVRYEHNGDRVVRELVPNLERT